MIKRLTWFVGGAVAGIAGAGYTKRKVKETAASLAPANVAKSVVGKARERSHDVVDAVREGRSAMKAKEAELKARLSGDAVTLADELGPEDQVLVDGRPVQPGQVIVLRQMRETDTSSSKSGPRRHSRRGRRST